MRGAITICVLILVLLLAVVLVAMSAGGAAAGGAVAGGAAGAPAKTEKVAALLEEIRRTGHTTHRPGNRKPMRVFAGVGADEGQMLETLAAGAKVCVEVGMANGVSTLHILKGLGGRKGTRLISIDPKQSGRWKGMGVRHVAVAGMTDHHTLVEQASHEAMPELLKTLREKIDLVFVDGWHTFDHTLIDIFYGGLLLRPGGLLVVDDVLHAGVKEAVRYFDLNYRHWKRLSTYGPENKKVPATQAMYVKKGDDDRPWNFHVSVCKPGKRT